MARLTVCLLASRHEDLANKGEREGHLESELQDVYILVRLVLNDASFTYLNRCFAGNGEVR